MDILPIDIEVVNEDSLDEAELSQFIRAEPMQVDDEQQVVGAKVVRVKGDGELIHEFLDGKLSFNEYKCQVIDEDADASDGEADEDEIVMDEEIFEGEASTSVGAFETELVSQRKAQLRGQFSRLSTGKRGRSKKSILPPALQGLMGEANLRYARGEKEVAETICLEIIRQYPLAVEPFHTLAQIYEGRDQEKCMQFMFIAGHLNPSDVHHWLHLADLSEEMGNIKQQYMCLSQAMRADPYDLSIRKRRIELSKKMGDDKLALKLQLHMVGYIKDAEQQLAAMKEVADKYHELGIPEKALVAYIATHKRNGDKFSVEDVNKFLELLMDAKRYTDALSVLCKHTKLALDVTPKTKDGGSTIVGVKFPAEMIPEFRTKAAVCLIHSKNPHLYPIIVDDVLAKLTIDDYGDFLLDIAEALMDVECFEEALRLLEPLVQSEKFGLAAVFLRYADCLRKLGEIDRAIENYRQVVQMAPQHFDARLTLSALLKQKNQPVEALKALEQDLEADVLEPTLLFEHCYMLRETGNIEQYIDLCGVLLARHCVRFRHRDEVGMTALRSKLSDGRNALKEFREFRQEDIEDTEGPEFVKDSGGLDKEREYEMVVDVIKQAYHAGRFATMQNYAHQALTANKFLKHRWELHYMALVASIANRDFALGGVHAKELLLRNPTNRRAWNMYFACYQSPNVTHKYYRFVQRYLQKDEEKFEPELFGWKSAYSISSGSYQLAVKDLVDTFEKRRDPFAALLAAVALTHLSVQKFTHYKTDHINQAVVLMTEYGKHREKEAEQEVHYNTGRMLQQLGLNAAAVEEYKKVLACGTFEDPETAEILDLKKEAAYNLHILYRESGNFELARKYLYDHVVI